MYKSLTNFKLFNDKYVITRFGINNYPSEQKRAQKIFYEHQIDFYQACKFLQVSEKYS
jgi:hypothetical protein